MRYKTVELVVVELSVDERDWQPAPTLDRRVRVRGEWDEPDMVRRIKEAGGVWKA